MNITTLKVTAASGATRVLVVKPGQTVREILTTCGGTDGMGPVARIERI